MVLYFFLVMTIIPKYHGSIKMDGILKEKQWTRAYTVTSFKEFMPVYGKNAKYRTEAYIFTTEKYIYVGFKCYGPPPIVERKGRDMVSADFVSFQLAPLGDPATVFEFSVDAGGNILDLRNNNGLIDPSWDTDWKASAFVADSFYTVEMEIPFKSISYNRKKAWGINFTRQISKDKAKYYYMLPKMGQITPNMEFVHFKAPLSISLQLIPQIVFREDTVRDFFGVKHSNEYKNFAGDLRLKLEGNSLHFTYNPDFADVEADPFTVNISKYPRFLPEKRPFFVYDMGIFQLPFIVGMPLTNFVYTRMIGSDFMGNEIPLTWGLKAVLRQDPVKTGFLGVKTDSMETFVFVRPLLTLNDMQMGLLLGNYDHEDTLNRLISFDVKYEWKNFTALFIGAHSIFEERDTSTGNFLNFGLKWGTRIYNFMFYYQKIDSLFDISRLGFVQGAGYSSRIRFGKNFYTRKIPFISIGMGFMRKRDLNETPSFEVTPELSMFLKNGHSISIYGGFGETNSYDPFRDTLVSFNSWNLNLSAYINLPPNRVTIRGSARKVYNYQTGEIGTFYNGDIDLGIHISKNFSLSTNLAFSEGAGLKRTISTLHTGEINMFEKITLRVGYENVFSESRYYQPYYRYWTFVTYQLGTGGIYLAISTSRDKSGVMQSVSAVKLKLFITY